MKVKEVTNPEEQLALLRVIIDNTWGAIKQQADAFANKRISQQSIKPKPILKVPKVIPRSANPPSLPRSKTLNSVSPQPKAPAMSSTIGQAMYKLPQKNLGATKQTINAPANKLNSSLTDLEKDEVMSLSRGKLPKPL